MIVLGNVAKNVLASGYIFRRNSMMSPKEPDFQFISNVI